MWEQKFCTISKTARKYPQEIYAAVVRTIQLKWIFIQRITKNSGSVFAGVNKIIRETFLPRIFFRKTKYLSPIVEVLSAIPFKKSGLGLLNLVTSANKKCLSFQHASAELIQ